MNYLKNVNKIFKFWNIMKIAIIFALGIIVIDYLNIPSQFIERDLFLTIIIFLFLILLIIIDFIRLKSYKFTIAKSINLLDRNTFIFLITTLICGAYLIKNFKMYKFIILVLFFLISLCVLIWRMIYICKLLKKQNTTESNICDLKEFLERDIFQNNTNKLVLFSENELKINPNYLNKIINSNISLPKANSNIISEIAVRTIDKMYDYYNIQVDVDEKNRFVKMFSKLSLKFSDIRELKRFLNYISAYMQSQDMKEQVNIGDFIVMQLLKYLNVNLYNTIYNTPMFFVSEEMK